MKPTPKTLLYADAVAAVEQRIVDSLPDNAAVYLCDRILGRVAGSALPPADHHREPYTEAAFLLNQREREESNSIRQLLAGFGASKGA